MVANGYIFCYIYTIPCRYVIDRMAIICAKCDTSRKHTIISYY